MKLLERKNLAFVAKRIDELKLILKFNKIIFGQVHLAENFGKLGHACPPKLLMNFWKPRFYCISSENHRWCD